MHIILSSYHVQLVSLRLMVRKCQCYPFLYQFSITCDINDLTLIRPENSWIAQISHNNSAFHWTVHSITAYLTHHIFTSPPLTHSVSLTDLVYCVDIVNKVSVQYLVLLIANNAQIFTYFLLYL